MSYPRDGAEISATFKYADRGPDLTHGCGTTVQSRKEHISWKP